MRTQVVQTRHVTARIGIGLHARIEEARGHLGMSITDFLVGALEAACSRVSRKQWSCRRVWMIGTSLVGIGEEPPTGAGGVPLPASSWSLLAPASFWEAVDRSLGDDG